MIADSSGRFTPAIASRPLATVANAAVDDVPALLSEPDTPFTKNVVAAEAVDANESAAVSAKFFIKSPINGWKENKCKKTEANQFAR